MRSSDRGRLHQSRGRAAVVRVRHRRQDGQDLLDSTTQAAADQEAETDRLLASSQRTRVQEIRRVQNR